MVVFDTDYREAYELLKGYIPIFSIFYIIYFLLLLGLYKLLFLIQLKYIKRFKFISFGSIFVVLIISCLQYGFTNPLESFKNEFEYKYPGYVFAAFHQYYFHSKLLRRYKIETKNFYFHPYFLNNKDTSFRKVYVFLIGESSRYDHWHINGYVRNTSTHLDTTRNLLSFHNVCAAGGLTEYSVPLLLCGLTPFHFIDHMKRKSLVSLFKEAGFKTYWISDQTDYGNISVHKSEADSVFSLTTYYSSAHNYHNDKDLVDLLNSVLAKDTLSNLFIVIHMLGSHYNYSYRYPKSFSIFNPSDCKKIIDPTDYSYKFILTNAYDNSILYTDFLINYAISILDKLRNTSCFLFYVSDHGENLFDDSTHTVLHSTTPPSVYIAHVPIFIWFNDFYSHNYPNKILSLINNRFSSINASDQVFYTISDMADIRFRGFKPELSFCSDLFVQNRHLILGGDGHFYYFPSFK
ncbi:MAG: phosphoethanolamine transferase [Acidobacterium ailaaui]|nr:phosphoethanolamine transferase [Pseudacidobacterium ailaaui]